MTEDRPSPSLDELDARLRKARGERDSARGHSEQVERLPRGAFGLAIRVGADLVASMIVGVGGGLWFDHWLGSAPWGLIAFFGLGAAAGMLNVYRTVSGLGYGPGYRRIDKNGEPRDNGGDT